MEVCCFKKQAPSPLVVLRVAVRKIMSSKTRRIMIKIISVERFASKVGNAQRLIRRQQLVPPAHTSAFRHAGPLFDIQNYPVSRTQRRTTSSNRNGRTMYASKVSD